MTEQMRKETQKWVKSLDDMLKGDYVCSESMGTTVI